jgi:hypothetical protein
MKVGVIVFDNRFVVVGRGAGHGHRQGQRARLPFRRAHVVRFKSVCGETD